MTHIVGITARKGVGKSTLASMLQEEIEGAKIIAFADALREEVSYRCLHAAGYGDLKKMRAWLEDRKGTVFGPLLQGYGEFFREWYGRDHWINMMQDRITYDDPSVVIIPDVRYENEAEWIKAQNGLLISLEGPSRWNGDQRDEKHPSEAGVELCRKHAEFTLYNDYTLNALRAKAQSVATMVADRMEARACKA